MGHPTRLPREVRKVRKRKFDGKTYRLYGTAENKQVAGYVGTSVRRRGGLARVIGLRIYVYDTGKWR